MTSAAHRNRNQLGDFTFKPRTLLITAWALLVGGFGALAAFALLRLIGLITNLVFYQRCSVTVATICRGYLLGADPIFPVSTAGMHLTTEDEALTGRATVDHPDLAGPLRHRAEQLRGATR